MFGTVGMALIAVIVFACPGGARAECVEYDDFLHAIGSVVIRDAEGVCIEGSHAYVTGTNGLSIVDISDLKDLRIIGSVDPGQGGREIDVAGNHAYVAAYDAGLQVFDIADPRAPLLVSTLTAPGMWAYDVVVAGAYAYLAGSVGLQIIDISAPVAPQVVGELPTSREVYDIDVAGTYVYLREYGADLQVIDVADPAHPEIVGHLDVPGWRSGVAVSGDQAFVGGESYLQVVDIADPRQPRLVGFTELQGSVSRLTAAGSYVFAANWTDGIEVIDVALPWNPRVVGSFNPPGAAEGVAIQGDVACVASEDGGLVVVDVSNPASVKPVGVAEPGDYYYSVTVSEKYAYVTDYDGDLTVIDITKARRPEVVAKIDTPGDAREMAVAGDLVFVVDETAGIQVLDAANDHRIIGSLDNPGLTGKIVVTGDHAFVADGWSETLEVIDVSDPTHLRVVGSVDSLQFIYSLAVWGAHVLVVVPSGLIVIDIANPADPRVVGTLDIPDGALDVAVQGMLAYVVSWGYTLKVVNVADPHLPWIVGSVGVHGSQSVEVAGTHAYVAGSGAGVHIVDIVDPAHPRIVGSAYCEGDALDVAVSSTDVYLATLGSGLLILPRQCDASYPTEVAGFELLPERDHVVVSWRAPADGASREFRLVGDDQAQEWEVPFSVSADELSYAAVDRSPQQFGSDELVYRLLARRAGQDWNVVASGTTSLLPLDLPSRIVTACPNPFNPQTTVLFECRSSGRVQLVVHDLAGRRVAVLADEWLPAGRYQRNWQGNDRSGRSVAAGQYLVRLVTDDGVDDRKVLLVR
jgi:hypothetical protein